MLAYAAAQAHCVRRWAGGWRPRPASRWWDGRSGGMFARDLTADPTSHNLFLFEIMIGVMAALIYLSCLAMVR